MIASKIQNLHQILTIFFHTVAVAQLSDTAWTGNLHMLVCLRLLSFSVAVESMAVVAIAQCLLFIFPTNNSSNTFCKQKCLGKRKKVHLGYA